MTVRRIRALLAVVLLAAAAGVVAGCGDARDSPDAGDPAGTAAAVDSPLPDCAGLTESSAGETIEPPPGEGERLPDLTLPCFTGGAPVRLAELRGPAVVNLWASWCSPCREELPLLQAYADRTAGQVKVIGVVTGDRHAAAASLAEDLGIGFPALEDREESLRTEVGAIGLPATLFVDSAGQLRQVVNQPLTESTLADLATEHLGVSW